MQLRPSVCNLWPGGHSHMYPPCVLIHRYWHPPLCCPHSSTSVTKIQTPTLIFKNSYVQVIKKVTMKCQFTPDQRNEFRLIMIKIATLFAKSLSLSYSLKGTLDTVSSRRLPDGLICYVRLYSQFTFSDLLSMNVCCFIRTWKSVKWDLHYIKQYDNYSLVPISWTSISIGSSAL